MMILIIFLLQEEVNVNTDMETVQSLTQNQTVSYIVIVLGNVGVHTTWWREEHVMVTSRITNKWNTSVYQVITYIHYNYLLYLTSNI